ncbi:hypothetical protein ACFFHH_24800 [Cytobacillus solani]|uniref:hypothetical protein n=1 Tax=Cytobacillus solani TaxID=1637975 RepID=UPI0006AB7F1F|nr:hypothetical protein [Cytobacillus solani]KOP81891.1 hypothetical protein AMS60_04975 [Bacillus sp. FJAT-21945]USK56821.1 hypothetical protein LIS82_10260 [Cytobacillus solani]
MSRKAVRYLQLIFISFSLAITGCSISSQDSIVNSHAEAFLTKNNELQFRFKINEKILNGKEVYKVKVSIHNDRLASALGMSEIVYGASANLKGEYIEVDNKNNFIFMTPIPLIKDLHVYEIEEMIISKDAVSVEVYNDEEVFAKAFLTNFSSQL